ncbi:hypothetical protein TNCV_5108371 [Trichonephila clavipes]|nr:hypothetical protein TNCV_5108371 [Trichonephila clavipes]
MTSYDLAKKKDRCSLKYQDKQSIQELTSILSQSHTTGRLVSANHIGSLSKSRPPPAKFQHNEHPRFR